jgi:hypothetical protein
LIKETVDVQDDVINPGIGCYEHTFVYFLKKTLNSPDFFIGIFVANY